MSTVSYFIINRLLVSVEYLMVLECVVLYFMLFLDFLVCFFIMVWKVV